MSSRDAIVKDTAENAAENSTRRRRIRRRAPRQGTTEQKPRAAGGEGKVEREPRVIVSAPIPAESYGTVVVGRISEIIKRGRGRFGFILFGENSERARADTPRIYFNLKDYEETEYPPRKGYVVEFLCSKDAEERSFAANVKLTAAGKELAAAREAKISAAKVEDGAKEEAGGADPARRRRPRIADDRVIPLRVTCQGQGDVEHTVNATVSQSIGKLKHAATVAFDAPIHYNVFCQLTAANPKGVLLTKAILKTLSENDLIHLGEPDVAAEAKA